MRIFAAAVAALAFVASKLTTLPPNTGDVTLIV